MATPIKLLLLIAFYVYLAPRSCSHAVAADVFLESVPQLEKTMYTVLDGYPCIRILNTSGEIGCANPGRGKVSAPIVKYESSSFKLLSPSAVLVQSDRMQEFFSRISEDDNLSQNVAGVLIEASFGYPNETSGFSPVGKFPQADFAPYKTPEYEWNPVGSSLMLRRYNFPVILLSKNGTLTLQKIASKSQKKDTTSPRDVAEFDVVMQTTKTGSHTSIACLEEGSCLPLGGYSVWSSIPPINISSSEGAKPIILAVASQDSASFFRDKALGADSPLSGMIALLAAIDALSHMDVANFQKQLAFVFFTGESWGYLGSRRFLVELDAGADSVRGLNGSLIEKVLAIGSVGKGLNKENTTFFTHVEEKSSSTEEIVNALKHAAISLQSTNITVTAASSSTPGIPPSSLMPFLKKNSSTAGVVLEEFNTAFTNRFYNSHPDDSANINSSSIVSAATLVARALYVLASANGSSLSSNALESISVNASLIEELVSCLLTCEPGFSCDLVKKFIQPTKVCPNHYVGVFIGTPIAMPSFEYVDDTSRFLWNFLANRTSTTTEQGKGIRMNSPCSGSCNRSNEVCVSAETGEGVCVMSTTRYVPAYSTRLKYDSGHWTISPANKDDPLGEVDPVWTESFWNTIGLRVYMVQTDAYDRIVLLGGLGLTLVSYLGILGTKAAIAKALKRD